MQGGQAILGKLPVTNFEEEGDSTPMLPTDVLNEYWTRVRKRLQSEFGEATYASWFKELKLIDHVGDCVRLGAPSPFVRTWVNSHYGDRLQALWEAEDTRLQFVELIVVDRHGNATSLPASQAPKNGAGDGEPASSDKPADRRGKTPEGRAPKMAEPPNDAPRAEIVDFPQPGPIEDHELGAPLDKRYTFDTFVVGKSNELAHSAAERVCSGTDVPFNPFYLYGKVGLGKTHLMHAIAHEIRRRHPHRKVMYLSAESFMFRFINAIRYKNTMAFKEQFRSVDVLMIDDIQFIAGKDTTQEEFFHTFNALVDHNRQVIISADRSPATLDVEERLRSRLGWGLVADILPTDYELRLGILHSKAEEFARSSGNVAVPKPVLEFLARRIVSNIRELEGALTRVVAYAHYSGQPISIELTDTILRDLLRSNERRITIEDIQNQVAAYYQIRKSELLSGRRTRQIARPRQVAMYLCKQLTTRSLPEIGRKFGNRDHTTVMHAVKRIEELCQTDPGMEEDVERLRSQIEDQTGFE